MGRLSLGLGLPFFGGLYQPGWTVTIYTPSLESHDPERRRRLVALPSQARRSDEELIAIRTEVRKIFANTDTAREGEGIDL